MFVRYDSLIKHKQYIIASEILDSIEYVFQEVPGYSASYETGIVFNNRASIYISRALYESSDSIIKQQLLDTATIYTDSCISLYNTWIEQFGHLTEDEILATTKQDFPENAAAFKGKNYKKILNKRVDDMILAQKETPRRLSVAYTNLGIIQRHQLKQKEAVESYMKAMSLWKDNPAALSNLNVLYGKPPKDRSLIKKLFPPGKNN
jgi:tetratricopeptide (TPR) repeat protein